jgi:hypothetical protein
MMDRKPVLRAHHATALVAFAAVVFYLFFQINKNGPFRELNPFGVDPYDAVGSFAIQVALLVGLLTYARALRILADPAQAAKMRLVLRGNLLVLFAILVTLLADGIAVILHPLPPTYWGRVSLIELGLMLLLAVVCAFALAAAFWRLRTEKPPRNLTPADAIDDLWTLLRLPLTRSSAVLPHRMVGWVESMNSDRFFRRLPWLNPRLHPWRFAFFLGVLVGAGLVIAGLQEGLPPSLQIGLLVMGIFISAELAATLIGFALLGGYLGLRPSYGSSV